MNVLAANDQENRVRNLHAGAEGKSLNAGLKGFNAKTPGNKAPKTPFKHAQNDENAVFKAGKSVLQTKGKGNENLLMTTKKGGKVETNAFVTPAGPRNRAPLGMKTTNARTKAFQTPAPLSASGKTQKVSPRLHRPKVKVLQEEAKIDDQEDDVPEVEYMPPKSIPLLDNLDEDMPPINWDFPQFKGENMTRGMWSLHNPIEEDGRTRRQREFEEAHDKQRKVATEEFDKLFEEVNAEEQAEARRYLGIESPKKAAPKADAMKKKASVPAPSTMKARAAAAALSPPPKSRYTAPTVAAKSRLPSTLLPGRKPMKPTMNPSVSRNAAAAAASKSTIGYAKGRATGGSPPARKPLSNVTRPPSRTNVSSRYPNTASSTLGRSATTGSVTARPRGPFSRSSSTSTQATLVAPQQDEQPARTAEDVENEMRLLLLSEENDDDDEAWMNSFNNQIPGDAFEDDLEPFQLQLPEGL